MEWMILPLKRYFDFRGRSRRKEFWMFVLFTAIVSILLSIVDAALGLGGSVRSYTDRSATGFAAGAGTRGGVLANLFSLAMFIPSIAVTVRRVHDIDRTGWWVAAFYGALIGGGALMAVATLGGGAPGGGLFVGGALILVGAIGAIVLLVWACLEGTRGPNRFGPDPKGGFGDLEETFR